MNRRPILLHAPIPTIPTIPILLLLAACLLPAPAAAQFAICGQATTTNLLVTVQCGGSHDHSDDDVRTGATGGVWAGPGGRAHGGAAASFGRSAVINLPAGDHGGHDHACGSSTSVAASSHDDGHEHECDDSVTNSTAADHGGDHGDGGDDHGDHGDHGSCGSQAINGGTITVWNNQTNLFVLFTTTGDFLLTQTQVDVATSLAGIATCSGVPQPGSFPIQMTHSPNVASFLYTISLGSWTTGTQLFVAAHSSVTSPTKGSADGWGFGPAFSSQSCGSNQASYFTFTVQPCTIIE
ncbi:MAG TPA: hypothetical protein VOA87_02860 [Thermoanaerobaculia bacterium]|nr:hypothetical protein [Thermoanaerobaculia bacterium]